MAKPAIVAVSARRLRGSVMGSPQATTILSLRVQALPVGVVRQVRSVVAAQLPRWFVDSGDLSVTASFERSGDQALLSLFVELIAAIQREAGIAVGKPLKNSYRLNSLGEATVYLPTQSLKASEIAVNWAIFLLNVLLSRKLSINVAGAINKALERLNPFAEKGVNNLFILQAAFELGIPVWRPVKNLLVLGSGCRSRWLQSLISDQTPLLGMRCAQAKDVTATLLRTAGLPGSIHQLAETKERAIQIAEALGYPVVVKPADADRGAGVAAGLKNRNSVALAFDTAVNVSRSVLVERWVPGHTHRLTVQDGRVIRVARRIAGGVVGDGEHTIEELVTLFQQTPQQQRRARRLGSQALALDEEALALLGERGLTAKSRPIAGEYICLRRRDNVNAGGTNQELLPDDPSEVHPDNLRLAIEAARVLRLDFAGIDFITTDIAKSWLEVGGVICEVNARPQMSGNNDPLLYQRLLKRLFPHGATIPTDLIIVPENISAQGRIRDELLRPRSDVAISLSSGLWINGRCSTLEFKNSFDAAQALLQRQEVTRALCLMTATDIHQHGLPLLRYDTVKLLADAVFTPEEAKLLANIKEWLQAAVPVL